MSTQQGDLALLNDPIAQQLLNSTNLAHLSYIWSDGTPRVAPVWFHWDDTAIVLGSPPNAPKVKALPQNAQVSLSIDNGNQWPYNVLLIRGFASITIVDGVVPEYAKAAERYFGPEQGKAWTAQMEAIAPSMARIAIQPDWVSVLDFEERFPSAVAAAMEG